MRCLLSAATAARTTNPGILSIALIAVAFMSSTAHGFVQSTRYGCVSRSVPTYATRSALHATGADDAIPTTDDGMKDLIIDLSKEGTDDVRRSRLQSIIVQGLEEGDETFSALFQQALEAVGNEVQAEARELAMQRYEERDAAETINEEAVAASAAADASSGDSNNTNGESSPIRVEKVNETSEGTIKSPLETQLWALVDMMVQSKTMIKKAKGQLGSKGTFQ